MANRKGTIVECTIHCFFEHGYDFSLDDVAKAADCSKTLVIHYFTNRKGLMAECFDIICREVKERLTEALDHVEGGLEDYLRLALNTYLDYLLENPMKANYYIHYSFKIRPFPRGYNNPNAVVRKILGNRCDALKVANEDMDLVSVANAVAAGMFNKWYGQGDDVRDKIVDMILDGIKSVVLKRSDRPIGNLPVGNVLVK